MKFFFSLQRIMIISMTISLTIMFVSTAFSETISADLILKKADEIRSPQSDYKVIAKITSQRPGKQDSVAIYEVMIKGNDKTVVKTLAPEQEKGTSLLMLKYDLWVFMQTISKPLRISLQQRLFGEAANGDIARVNMSGDYIPQLKDTVIIKDKQFYLLELTAKNEQVTYNKILIWVMKDTYYPLQAEFYAFSGKLLKKCYYTNYKEVLGVIRPTQLLLDNPLIEGQRSIIEYSDMALENFSDKIFTKQYMQKLKY